MERKCPHCGTWNGDNEYCKACNKLISPEKIAHEEAQKRQQKIMLRKPTRLDNWLDYLSHSRNPLVKIIYYTLYSVWVVFAALIGFALYIVAASPG